IARCSIGDDKDFYNENLLFDMFGINAELLIDHAWGYENCLMKDIKAYKPENSSLSSGQVLSGPYEYEKAKLVMREMTDALVLDMVEKNVLADQMVITIGYDRKIPPDYKGAYEYDHYGRMVPEGSHGSINLGKYTSSGKLIIDAVMQLFDQIVNKKLYVRRMYVVANHIMDEKSVQEKEENAQVQLNLFTDYEMLEKKKKEEKEEAEKEKKLQKALLGMKKKYGKNAILRGMDLEEGATTIERNNQVGGHKA
ncbi:MAG TPA: DNA methylase, partial [Lachnospiraceae bacterium]|nr:DNA methylase [Lachnospiraceae bacterium]